METLMIHTGGEWFIQCGFTRLRSPTGMEIAQQEPQFIKSSLKEIKAFLNTEKSAIYKLKSGVRLVEIGSITKRTDKEKFAEKIPLYGLMQEENKKAEISCAEKQLLNDIGKVFADKFKQYIDGVNEAKEKDDCINEIES